MADTSRDNPRSRRAGCLILLLMMAALAFVVPFMGAAWASDPLGVTAYLFGAWAACIILAWLLSSRRRAAPEAVEGASDEGGGS